jgi:hypothetical protein
MAANETYEMVVQKALETVRPGPWSVVHLVGLEWVIDDAFCALFEPHCDASAINHWLQAMSPGAQGELISRLNENLQKVPVGPS